MFCVYVEWCDDEVCYYLLSVGSMDLVVAQWCKCLPDS